MLSDYSCASFQEQPQHVAGNSRLCLLFLFMVDIVERLLYRLSQTFLECSWIETEQFPVKPLNGVLLRQHLKRTLGTAPAVVQL